jgi:hypothetical protein
LNNWGEFIGIFEIGFLGNRRLLSWNFWEGIEVVEKATNQIGAILLNDPIAMILNAINY